MLFDIICPIPRCDAIQTDVNPSDRGVLCSVIVLFARAVAMADEHHHLVVWEGNIYHVAGVEYEDDADVCLCRTMRIRVGDALLRPVAFFGDAKTGQHAFLPVYMQHTTNMTMQCSMISC